MAEMLEQVSTFDQDIEFIIGHAGTGKSTKLVKMYNDKTLVLTPTHKAISVLKKKGINTAFTIHSVLNLVPTIDENYKPHKGQRMQKLKRIGNVDLADIKQVFIDEFSMINQRIFDTLLELLPEDAKVVVFGDPYQLPPVSGEIIDPLIYTDKITKLTTQYRADAPEVVETFERFVSWLEKRDNSISLVMHKDIVTAPFKVALKEFGYDPKQDIILAYTNEAVISMNSVVSKYLGLSSSIEKGDEIVINGIDAVFDGYLDFEDPNADWLFPSCISKGAVKPELAVKALTDIRKYNVDLSGYGIARVITGAKKYQVYYATDHYAKSKELEKEVEEAQKQVYLNNTIPDDVALAKWCKENYNAPYVKERGKAWSNFLKHQGYVFDMRHPYVRTVHKAQGSEFRTVYINQKDLKIAIRPGYYEQYARLMYVALSRAIDKVVIVEV